VFPFSPTIEAFRPIKLHTIAIGDSYNDTSMPGAADKGILFHPSETVKRDFPQFTVVENHGDLKTPVAAFLDG
jgi:phosphoserine/homoserine phosphotransferase